MFHKLKFTRVILLFCNIFLLVYAVLLQYFGNYYVFDKFVNSSSIVPDKYKILRLTPELIIIFGVLGLVTICIGFKSVWAKRPILLHIFGAALTILFILQLSYALCLLTTTKDLEKIKAALDDSIKIIFDEFPIKPKNSKLSVSIIQRDLNCCGLQNVSYWDQNPAGKFSCEEENYSRGCQKAIFDYIKGIVQKMWVICFVGVGLEILVAAFSFWLGMLAKTEAN